eukprot:COSAG06_NODE_1215_length_10233_cov_68.717979_2_plen_90_part_00
MYHNTLCTKYNYTLTRFYVVILSVLHWGKTQHVAERFAPSSCRLPAAPDNLHPTPMAAQQPSRGTTFSRDSNLACCKIHIHICWKDRRG